MVSNYRSILAEIDGLGRPVTLIAVSKGQPVEKIKQLYDLGHRDFGENYVQELQSKASDLVRLGCNGIQWHFLGHLQRNKVRAMMTLGPRLPIIHSIDRIAVIEALAKAVPSGQKLQGFVEVRLVSEENKTGADPAELATLLEAAAKTDRLRILGLMTIASNQSDPRPEFEALRKLALETQGHERQLSMGMSGDYPMALRLGATHIRLGTKLFGSRTTVDKS